MTDDNAPIRLLDLGTVDPLRSQTIFHAVGYAMTDGSPDTIMLISPDAPYVSIGRHQDVDREVDRAVCAELGFPVIRREVGGGAVYLDGNQLFTQWIFAAEHLPATVEERFTLYCNTLLDAHAAVAPDGRRGGVCRALRRRLRSGDRAGDPPERRDRAGRAPRRAVRVAGMAPGGGRAP